LLYFIVIKIENESLEKVSYYSIKNIKYDKPVFVFILYYILINVKLKTFREKIVYWYT